MSDPNLEFSTLLETLLASSDRPPLAHGGDAHHHHHQPTEEDLMEQAWSNSAANVITTSATPPPVVFKETEVRPTFMVNVPLMQCIGTPLMRGAVEHPSQSAVDCEVASVALRTQQLKAQLSTSPLSASTTATNTPSSPSYSFSPYSPVYSSPVYSPEQQQQLLHQQLQHQQQQQQQHEQRQRQLQLQHQQQFQRQYHKSSKPLSCSTSTSTSTSSTIPHSQHKEFHIIDMTHQTANRASCEFTKSPSMNVASASSSPVNNFMIESPAATQEPLPATPNSGGASRRRKGAPDAKKSMVARSRPRDERGNFLPKGIAVRIEDLTHQLRDSKSECQRLREQLAEREKQLKERDKLLNQFRQQLPDLYQQHYPAASTSPPHQINNLSGIRYFTPASHTYQPHLYGPNADRAFKDKVDLSKITLRKTNSPFVSDEVQSVLSQQLQWDIMQGVNGIRRKADEHMGVQHPPQWFSQQVGAIPVVVAASPSDVFSQPNKIGNVLLPAFTEKVDLVHKVSALNKTPSIKVDLERQQQQQFWDQASTELCVPVSSVAAAAAAAAYYQQQVEEHQHQQSDLQQMHQHQQSDLQQLQLQQQLQHHHHHHHQQQSDLQQETQYLLSLTQDSIDPSTFAFEDDMLAGTVVHKTPTSTMSGPFVEVDY